MRDTSLDARPTKAALAARSSLARTGPSPIVSVVLPCLNEEQAVGACVRKALAALERAGLDAEVVVVDNGSTDNSVRAARESGARVIHERRKGYGNALRAGIAAARGEVAVMADADCTYELERIPDLVRPVLDDDADLVLGARLQGAGGGTMPLLHRYVGTPMLTFLVARATGGVAVTDSQSGFRAFRREAIIELGLVSGGMEFASEMLIQAARAGWRVREIPTQYAVRVGESKLNTFADGWRHLRLITLLAPDLILVGPGAGALLLGALLSLWALASPGGLNLGSLQWQPVFFSTIAMVLGAQSLLAGCVMAHHSPVAASATRRRFAFVGSPRFPRWCVLGGLWASAAGLTADLALFGWWMSGLPAPSRGLPLASLAQSLLIVGCTVAVFGVISRLLLDRRGGQTGSSILDLGDGALARVDPRTAPAGLAT